MPDREQRKEMLDAHGSVVLRTGRRKLFLATGGMATQLVRRTGTSYCSTGSVAPLATVPAATS